MQPSTLELFLDILRETDFLATQSAQTTLEAFIADEVKSAEEQEQEHEHERNDSLGG